MREKKSPFQGRRLTAEVRGTGIAAASAPRSIASLWLAWKGDLAWAAFLGVLSLVTVSGVDNILKPVLISLTSALSFVLAFLGAVGEVLGFGLVGILLVTLLAIASNPSRTGLPTKPARLTRSLQTTACPPEVSASAFG